MLCTKRDGSLLFGYTRSITLKFSRGSFTRNVKFEFRTKPNTCRKYAQLSHGTCEIDRKREREKKRKEIWCGFNLNISYSPLCCCSWCCRLLTWSTRSHLLILFDVRTAATSITDYIACSVRPRARVETLAITIRADGTPKRTYNKHPPKTLMMLMIAMMLMMIDAHTKKKLNCLKIHSESFT